MKSSKNGFTFIELMFVMVLLALLVILAYPYILNAYLKAQKDVFIIESKEIYNKAEEKYASALVKGKRLSTITDAKEEASLNYGEGKIKYCVHLTPEGYVRDIKVVKDNFYLEGKTDFLSTAKFETVKYGEIFDKFNCDYELAETDLRVEPTLKEIKSNEDYLNAIKFIGITFIVVIVVGLITSNKNRRSVA